MAADDTADQEPTYGNWLKPSSPGIGNLGLGGTILLLTGLAVDIAAWALNLIAGLVTLAVLAAVLIPLAKRDRHGRTMLANMFAALAWSHGRRAGQHLYRSGPLSVTTHGTFLPPGLAAQIVMHDAHDSYGRLFGLLQVPSTGHYSVVLECAANGADLVDPEQVNTWVAHWGAWLASLAFEPGLVAVAVTIETAPDPGTRLATEVNGQLHPRAPKLARSVMKQVVEEYPPGSAQISTRVCLTWSAEVRRGARARSSGEVIRETGTRLPGLAANLASTGAGEARPMTATQIAEVVRVAYDPAAHPVIERARADGGTSLDWEHAGPVFHQAARGHYLHESAASITWAMTEPPRGVVYSEVLRGLLAPHPAITRKRVTITYRPHDPVTAAHVVGRDVSDTTFALGGKNRVTESRKLAFDKARKAEREEATGAGVVLFAMLVTATVASEQDLPEAAAAVDMLAPAARLRMRRMYGCQDGAFAAALPIGIVLPYHVLVPQEIRDAI